MRKYLIFLAIILTILLTSCFRDSDEKSLNLFSDALQQYNNGKNEYKTNYQSALTWYKSAVEKLEELTGKFPKSAVAIKIKNDEPIFDMFSLNDMKQEVIPALERCAFAENSFFNCSLYLAGKNIDLLLSIASEYSEIYKVKSNEALKTALESLSDIKDQPLKAQKTGYFIEKCFELKILDYINEAATLLDDNGKRWLAVRLSNIGEFVKADNYINSIEDKEERMTAYLLSAEKAIEWKQKEKATHYINEALKLCDKSSIKNDKLSNFAVLSAKAGLSDEAAKLVDDIDDNIVKCNTLNEIAKVYIESGLKEEGLKILSDIIKITKLVDNKSSHLLFIHENIAESYYKAEEYEKAYQIILNNCNNVNFIAYEHLAKNLSLLTQIIINSDKAGQSSYSDKVLYQLEIIKREIKAGDINQNILIYVIEPLVESHLFSKVSEIITIIKDPLLATESHIVMAKGYIASGLQSKALNELNIAAYKAEQISNVDLKISKIIDVLEMLSQAGDNHKADIMLNKVLDHINEVESLEDKEDFLIRISDVYFKIDKQKEAINIIDSISTAWKNNWALEIGTQILASKGNLKDAYDTLCLIENLEYKLERIYY